MRINIVRNFHLIDFPIMVFLLRRYKEKMGCVLHKNSIPVNPSSYNKSHIVVKKNADCLYQLKISYVWEKIGLHPRKFQRYSSIEDILFEASNF